MLHQNVQSLGNSVDQLQYLLQQQKECRFLCITEHWKTKEQLNVLTIQNFKLVCAVCREEGSHGGAAVYVHESIESMARKKICEVSVIGSIECAVAECYTGGKSIVIASIYRSPNGDVTEFLDKLETILNIMCKENKSMLIAGDYNIEMKHENKNKTKFLSLMESFGLKPTIHQYTRIAGTSKSCIDNIFTNMKAMHKAEVLETHISDHTAQKLTLQWSKPKPATYVFKQIFNKKSIVDFKQQLRKEDWKMVYDIEKSDIDEQWMVFSNIFLRIFNDSFPLKKVKESKVKKFRYNEKQLDEIKRKLDILLVLSRCDKQYIDTYKETKKEYDRKLKNCKSKYYEDRIMRSDNKTKTMWSICGEIIGKNKQENKCQLEGDMKTMAENYNKYIVEAVKTLRSNVNMTTCTDHIPENDKSMYIRRTQPSEIVEIAKSLKSKYSSGDDGIPTRIIRECIEEIKDILSYIINGSFKYGIFPNQLKIAVIKPLFKGGEKSEMNNYRPISLLSGFSKIFEIAMSTRITNFLEECNIFSNTQHGYLKGKSTQTAIHQFTQSIINLLEDNKIALGIFIDLTKAYDCINRNYLLQKMCKYGIRGNAQKWFQSYFSNRQQRVKISGDGKVVKSSILTNNEGVAQGSIIGPLAFILFINDLSTIVIDSKATITNYADDTNLIIGYSDPKELVVGGNEMFLKTKKWCDNNNLVINSAKTKLVIFNTNRSNKEKPAKINIDGKDIAVTNNTQFLGVIIDEYLKWTPQINKLSRKLNSICYGMKILNQYLDNKVQKTVYHANFESVMRYGIIFWGSSYEVESIFIIQKRAIRTMLGMNFRQSCRGIFKCNNILTVYALYLYECLMFLYRNQNLFAQNISSTSYNTRRQDLNYPKHRLSLTEKNPSYMCLRIFNKLPREIKEINSQNKFKKETKKLLINLEPYSLNDYFQM